MVAYPVKTPHVAVVSHCSAPQLLLLNHGRFQQTKLIIGTVRHPAKLPEMWSAHFARDRKFPTALADQAETRHVTWSDFLVENRSPAQTH